MAWGCPSRLGGTTVGCGSRTGERGRSSPSTWTATAKWLEKAQTASAGRRTRVSEGPRAGRGRAPDAIAWAQKWLPDAPLLITGPELTRVDPDGSPARHADLSHIS